MRHGSIKMTTRVERLKLLGTLKGNMKKHQAVVREANAGYLAAAEDALTKRLAEVRAGRPSALSFHLQPPSDHTEVYENAISMLEWNTEEHVELEADEFRQLVRDEWDWTDSFLMNNSGYSATAGAMWANKRK